MKKGTKQYRLIIHNLYPDGELITNQLEEELGEEVEIVDWDEENIWHYKSMGLPQRDILVNVTFKDPVYAKLEQFADFLDMSYSLAKMLKDADFNRCIKTYCDAFYEMFPELKQQS